MTANYNIWADGSCYHIDPNNNWMGMGVYIEEDSQIEEGPIERSLSISGPKGTHNDAEYLAIMCALTWLYTLEGASFTGLPDGYTKKKVVIHSDSQLVIRQIIGEYQVKKKHMKILYAEVMSMVFKLNSLDISFEWNSRTHKKQQFADRLSKKANKYFNKKLDEKPTGVTDISEVLLPGCFKTIYRGLNW